MSVRGSATGHTAGRVQASSEARICECPKSPALVTWAITPQCRGLRVSGVSRSRLHYGHFCPVLMCTTALGSSGMADDPVVAERGRADRICTGVGPGCPPGRGDQGASRAARGKPGGSRHSGGPAGIVPASGLRSGRPAGEGIVSDLLPGTSSGGRGGGRLPNGVEAVVREILRTRYRTRQRRTAASLCREERKREAEQRNRGQAAQVTAWFGKQQSASRSTTSARC